MYAAPATSASVMALVGRSAHRELAVAQLDVLRRRLELMGDDRLGLGRDLVGRSRRRLAADGERARAVRVEPEWTGVGVAVDHLDLLRVDAELVGDDLREPRLVTLAVRGRAGVQSDRAGAVDADRGGFPDRRPGARTPPGPTARDGALPQISV